MPEQDRVLDREPLDLFVPAPGSELEGEVVPGSGIVGSEVGETARLRIDFEGDAELFPRYADRVRRAGSRHLWRGPGGRKGYPTKASAIVDPGELIRVGAYYPREKRLDVERQELLASWLEADELSPRELEPSTF